MSRQAEREEFVAIMAEEGIPVSVARDLMRASATLHRIAELECSSEAADRDRVPCPGNRKGADRGGEGGCLCLDYGSYDPDPEGIASPHGSIPRIAVKEERLKRRLLTMLKPLGIFPVFSGDPRGAVLKLRMPSGRTNDWGREGVVVP